MKENEFEFEFMRETERIYQNLLLSVIYFRALYAHIFKMRPFELP